MGLAYGGAIVRDGLVLALDAADNNSFRGEPTVNYIADIGNPTTETTGNEFQQYFNLVPIFETYGLVPYTLSMEIKGNIPGSCLVYMQNGSYTKYAFVSTWVQLTTEYQRFIFPNLTPSGPTSAWLANTPNDNRAMLATYTIYGSGRNPTVKNIQIEAKTSATRFTTGTRGTTVATGGGWKDISGNDNHGEILNGTTTSNDGSVLGALDFDGTDDYINIDESITLGSEWSVEAWIYLINGNDYTHIFSSQTAQTEFTCKIAKTSDDRKPYFYKNGVVNTFSGTSKGLDLNTWHHLVYTYDGSTVRIYIDTEEVRSVSATMNIGSDTYSIGDSGNTNEFGTFRLSKHTVRTRNLTASEVLQNYNATKTRFGL